MSLQYRTEVYIRKAIRRANIVEAEPGRWTASLPAFGLQAEGDSRDDAETNLLMRLTIYVRGASGSGHHLPVIDDIDLNSPDDDQAWFWTADWQAGEREADAELAAGQGVLFESGEDFLASLESRHQELRAQDR